MKKICAKPSSPPQLIILVGLVSLIASVVLTLPVVASIVGGHPEAPANGSAPHGPTAEGRRNSDGGTPDKQAVEGAAQPTRPAAAGLNLVVNTLSDVADTNVGDGHCDTDGNPGNGDQCSLRAAIQETNAAATDDVITFSTSLNGGTITLNSALDFIAGNLVLTGPGASQLNIQRSSAAGTPSFRIFGINHDTVVSVSGLTISNGSPTSGENGGGIFNSGTLTMTDCNVFGNSVVNGFGRGGGIHNTFVLTLNNCNIGGAAAGQGNSANDGGGVYNLGSSFVMTGGSVSGNSGNGIAAVFGATATLSGVAISGNTTGTMGGGVEITAPGTASIESCLISGNAATSGGGIYNGGAVSVVNSTISGNTSSGSGGGIFSQGNFLNPNPPITLTNVTITNNRSDSDNSGGEQGGAVFRDSGTITLNNTILAGNFRGASPGTTADDISGTVAPASAFNLIGTGGSGGLTNGNNNNQVGVASPMLGPLADNGGATQTHVLLPGSPALDAGNSTLSADQRGQPRPIDDQTVPNASGSNGSDIGAYEAHTLQVNSIADTSDGACTTLATGNGCTLREAIIAANAENGAELVLFAPALIGSGPATITLLNALPDLSGDMIVSGLGAGFLTVKRSTAGGTPDFSVFTIADGKTVRISGLTVSNGKSVQGGGFQNSGNLTLGDCIVSGNSGGGIDNSATATVNNSIIAGNTDAGGIINHGTNGLANFSINNSTISGNSSTGRRGGALSNFAGLNSANQARLTINSSTVSGNVASDSGGGIYNDAFESATSTLTINSSTLSGNTATNNGGAIYNLSSDAGSVATLIINNATISENRSFGIGGGIATAATNSVNTVLLRNTIVAANVLNPGIITSDISGVVDPASSFNLIGDGTGMLGIANGSNGNQIGNSNTPVNPRLGPLTNQGGPTQTYALLAGSPALDAGDDSVTGPPLNLLVDQRGPGFARRVDGPDPDTTARVDIGAFEAQVSLEDIADRTANEDTPLQFSFNVGGAGSITSVTATSSNTTLVPNNVVNLAVTGSGSLRILTITPAGDRSGASTITVTVNGSNSQSMVDTFLLTINPVNDPPAFTKGADQTISNNAGMQTISNWATGLSVGPVDESSQTLSFLVTGNDNPGLFATAPAVSATGTLSYSPATNAGGTANITLVARDSGGTANGGQDTSAPQTFKINVNPAGGFISFSSANFTTTESSGFTTITVKRTGDTSLPVTVDFATGGDSGTPCSTVNGVASPKCDFTAAFGVLRFAAGEDTKTLTILITQDSYVEGPESLPLTLANATGFGALTTPATTSLTITDDASEPAGNPIDDVDDFVRQHYYDFLSRVPDSDGLTFWIGQITQCGNDQACVRSKRIDVSNAFFYELEYQQTGSYVYRVYRAAFGSNQPFPNPIPDPNNPGEEKKVVAYSAFAPDRARVVGGANLAQGQLDFANAFVQRPDFLTKYPPSLSAGEFVDAILAIIKNDVGADLTAQRQALIDLFNQAGGGNSGRGAVTYRLADDNLQTNPIDNRAFINAEYNRAFVATQYFGYLRRDPDMGGFLFWLGQVSRAPLRDVSKQHAMVCSFTTSAEYQLRFSSLVTHTNGECQ